MSEQCKYIHDVLRDGKAFRCGTHTIYPGGVIHNYGLLRDFMVRIAPLNEWQIIDVKTKEAQS